MGKRYAERYFKGRNANSLGRVDIGRVLMEGIGHAECLFMPGTAQGTSCGAPLFWLARSLCSRSYNPPLTGKKTEAQKGHAMSQSCTTSKWHGSRYGDGIRNKDGHSSCSCWKTNQLTRIWEDVGYPVSPSLSREAAALFLSCPGHSQPSLIHALECIKDIAQAKFLLCPSVLAHFLSDMTGCN